MKRLCSILLVFSAALIAISSSDKSTAGSFVFRRGALGTIYLTAENNASLKQGLLPTVAMKSLAAILHQQEGLGATGKERFKPAKHKNRVVQDKRGHSHVRMEQTYHSGFNNMEIDIVDAAVVMHIDVNGHVYALNGEFVVDGAVGMKQRYTCDEVFATTLDDESQFGSDAVWLSECALKIVIDKYGDAHMAWQRMIGYTPVLSSASSSGPYQKTYLYASVVTGVLVAIRPQVHGALRLRTEDCNNRDNINKCQIASTSKREIATFDNVINDAHNYARSVWKYYMDNFGRDSVDDMGLEIVSFVHFGQSYNNAYWDGTAMTYGDGDGTSFGPLTRAADVVGHELTHGVTQYSSSLVYQDESGALNEAMSDIFGASVDRSLGASISDTWKIAETIYTPGKSEDALRYMANPTQSGQDYDWYPDRYQGPYDSGGVHINSGIMNLAFVLMVQGGKHPRGKSPVVVPAIDKDFDTSLRAAAQIFYLANTACLTPMSGFYEIRQCTMLHAGEHLASVEAAWEAVGLVIIVTGVPITDISAARGSVSQFGLTGVAPGTIVSCTTVGENGDADLYMTMEGIGYGQSKSCTSTQDDANETCAVGPLNDDVSKVWVTVVAYTSFSGLTLTCTRTSTSTALTDGVPLEGVGATLGSSRLFILSNVSPLTAVTCEIVAGTGKPSVYGSLVTNNGDISEYDPCNVSPSQFVKSSAICIFNSPRKSANLYIGLYAAGASFSGARLTCSLQPIEIHQISNWVTFSDANAEVDDRLNIYSLGGITLEGQQVSCYHKLSEIATTNLEVYFGDANYTGTVPATLGCASAAGCTTFAAGMQTAVYAEFSAILPLDASQSVSLQIICGKEPSLTSIANDVPISDLSGTVGSENAMQLFHLNGVTKGDKVRCVLTGASGNADLYVRAGSTPYPLSSRNACESTGATSTETCTTPFVARDTSIFVAVHAVADYVNASLVCARDDSFCRPKRSRCRRSKQCCGSATTCDGTTIRTRKCKRAIRGGGSCNRSSQCYQGYACRKRRCVRRSS